MTTNTDIKDWLKQNFSDQVKFDEPMRQHTTFKVGGNAEIFVSPVSNESAIEIINMAGKTKTPVFTVGRGSNLIVKDTGIKGIVLSLEKIETKITARDSENDQVVVSVNAGAGLNTLCRFAINNGLAGLNFALGIPGSVGGSISMNAGTATGEMKDVIQSLEILNGSGKLKRVNKSSLNFSYRKLNWGDVTSSPVIFNADFLLKKGNTDELKKESSDLLTRRNKTQPVSLPNAGCIFKNPDPENPAGKLIDLAGLKGMKCGNAQISDKHANFITNNGGASASEILSLIAMAKEKVFNKFNIKLETEVQIVG